MERQGLDFEELPEDHSVGSVTLACSLEIWRVLCAQRCAQRLMPTRAQLTNRHRGALLLCLAPMLLPLSGIFSCSCSEESVVAQVFGQDELTLSCLRKPLKINSDECSTQADHVGHSLEKCNDRVGQSLGISGTG